MFTGLQPPLRALPSAGKAGLRSVRGWREAIPSQGGLAPHCCFCLSQKGSVQRRRLLESQADGSRGNESRSKVRMEFLSKMQKLFLSLVQKSILGHEGASSRCLLAVLALTDFIFSPSSIELSHPWPILATTVGGDSEANTSVVSLLPPTPGQML